MERARLLGASSAAVLPALALAFFAIVCLGGGNSPAHAFHSGGVAQCEGCHTMHNSFGGVQMDPGTAQFTAGPHLLQGTDQSSVCLNCHQQLGAIGASGFLISTPLADMPLGIPPRQLTPGGDFGWLRKDYTWIPETGAAQETSLGERHGHNIIALDFGYAPDGLITRAPGGTYAAENLHCTSCHDPHGKYRRNNDGSITTTGKPISASGSYNTSPDPDNFTSVGVYRLLAGVGYAPESYNLVPFTFAPPAAVAPADYNRTEDIFQTRVAYGAGMSEWCANCHGGMHNDNFPSTLRHPAGNAGDLGPAVADNYNRYVKTGDLTGTQALAYLSLVPFEEGIGLTHSVADYTTLKSHARVDDSYLQGPEPTANVSCLSCHRAHASTWDSILRFNLGYEFMLGADTTTGLPVYPGTNSTYVNAAAAQGRTVAEHQRAAYDRPPTKFAPFQRVLCNKCHAKE